MPAIYEKQDTKVDGVWSSDQARLNFSGSATGVLVQGINFNYRQNVTRLFEVGSEGAQTNVYYVGGRTEGQCGLDRVIGPAVTVKEMYSQFGDVCKACDNTLEMKIGGPCCGSGSGEITYTLKGCVMVQMGLTVQAQDMVIREQCQLMFSGLDYV